MSVGRSATHRAALAYAVRFGWFVLPVRTGTKVPHNRFVRHGFRDATRDLEQINRWWCADPTAGVAVACSMSGLIVIDADLYKPECEFSDLEARLGPLPETPRQLTPQGGVHYLLRDTVGSYVNPCAGAEAKHEGYILVAPTIHPNGGHYKWDVGAHPLDTPVADLPDAWLAHLTRRTPERSSGPALSSSGTDAGESWLGYAFAAAGWLGLALPDGRRLARCPWLALHSDGRGAGNDTSTIVFPRAEGGTLGGFACMHSHCAERTWRDVVDVLPTAARWAADRAMRAERNRCAYAQLERRQDRRVRQTSS